MSKELVNSLEKFIDLYNKQYGIGFKNHKVVVEAHAAIAKFKEEGSLLFKLASAIHQFRHEKILLRCTKLRSTPGFTALVEAWDAYNAPVVEIKERIAELESEITANEEENRGLQWEVDKLYDEIDAINKGKP